MDKKSYEGQKNVRLCNYTDVYYNEKITNNMDFMVATATDAEIKSMCLKEGDVVITKDSEDPADIGIPAIISEPLDNVVCGYHLTVLRTKEPDAARYLHRAIQSHPSRAHFFVESPGVTRFDLNQEAIGGLTIPVPPIVERNQIAAFLDEKTTQIDQLIEKKTRFIELIKEKRAALITEAVTGKFDVRHPGKGGSTRIRRARIRRAYGQALCGIQGFRSGVAGQGAGALGGKALEKGLQR